MSTILAPSIDALAIAISARLIPEDVQRSPVRFELGEKGLRIESSQALSRDLLGRLETVGFRSSPGRLEGPEISEARTWPEIIPSVAAEEPRPPLGLVLFRSDVANALELSNDLLRLGCDRQELSRDAEGRCLIRALAAPYHVLMRALDAPGLAAYVPTDAGARVWVQAGSSHPLASRVSPAPGLLTLIPRRGPWIDVVDGPWVDLYERLEIVRPKFALVEARPDPPRIRVELRLEPSSQDRPISLWILRQRAEDQLDTLVRTLPEAILAELAFAQLFEGDAIVLRARSIGTNLPPALELDAEEYARSREIEELYLPPKTAIAPPLRSDHLRRLLVPSPERLAWIVPNDGTFSVQSLDEASFRPLAEWIEHVIARGSEELEAWRSRARFDFEPFVSIGVEWSDAPPSAELPDGPSEDFISAEPEPSAPEVPELPGPTKAEPAAPSWDARPSGPATDLLELERALLGGPRGAEAFLALARAYAAAERPRDARLCFTHALWASQERSVAEAWRDALRADAPVLELPADPDAAAVEGIADRVIRAGFLGESGLDRGAVSAWLAQHERALDVRSVWLWREAIMRLGGRDAISEARAREAVRSRIARGLSLGLDEPTFVRRFGLEELGANVEILGQTLEATLRYYLGRERRRSALEAPEAKTRAYVRLVMAWGLARLAQADRAGTELRLARAALDLSDPVHGYLFGAFEARIEQAIEGLPLEAFATGATLAELPKLERYKIERLQQASTILALEPGADPFGRFRASSAVTTQPTNAPLPESLSDLLGEKLTPAWLRKVRTACLALAERPAEDAAEAVRGLLDRLSGVTDNFNTNSHFCLSVVDFMESLVQALAGRKLEIHPLARRYLDEEEQQVRRRVHD